MSWNKPRTSIAVFFCLSFLLSAIVAPLSAAVLKIQLPRETASFKPGSDYQLANGQCLTCHSVEYVTTQPPQPRAFWEAAVKKMRDKFGAVIPDEQVPKIVDYLVLTYGAQSKDAVPVAVSGPKSAAPAPEQALSGEVLATRYGCLSCHNVSVKLVGPAYKDVAAKYRQDPAGLTKIAEQIHLGGSGKWGPVLMPPFPTVNERETRVLAEWILRQN